jgi:hypothetical protein
MELYGADRGQRLPAITGRNGIVTQGLSRERALGRFLPRAPQGIPHPARILSQASQQVNDLQEGVFAIAAGVVQELVGVLVYGELEC